MPKPEPTKTTQLSDLTPNPKNPRRISDERLAMLKKSLGEFGDLSGIIFNKRTGQLVGGHQRTKILPPDAKVVRVKTFEPATSVGTVAQGYVVVEGERYSYREVDWDPTKEKAANIAANKHSGEWDIPQLASWLVELDALHFDMDLLGFDEAEKANIIKNGIPTKVEGQCDDDEVPEPPKEPKSKPGDVYELGEHRVMCGDSTMIDQVERLMAGEKAETLFTDPPYNIDFKPPRGTHDRILNDAMNPERFREWLTEIFGCAVAATEGDSYAFVWCGWSTIDQFAPVLRQFYELKAMPIWVKNNFGIGYYSRPKYEPFFLCLRGEPTKPQAAPADVWEYAKVVDTSHSCEKPVGLIENILQTYTNGSVLDLFGGSGSTLIACEKTGRRAFVMEIDPRYVDVIVARYEKFTGKRAELVAPSS